MFLLVFLNNIGTKYTHTPHNVAMYYLEGLQKKFSLTFSKFSQNSNLSQQNINGSKVYFLQPLTYMNNSGVAVGEIANFYKINPQNIIVFHDDVDLKEIDLKLKFAGGHAGHNGLKSIDANITNQYNRIRIGVGKPKTFINQDGQVQKTQDTADFVLSKMNDEWIDIQQKKASIFMNTFDLLTLAQYEKFNALTTQNIKLALSSGNKIVNDIGGK